MNRKYLSVHARGKGARIEHGVRLGVRRCANRPWRPFELLACALFMAAAASFIQHLMMNIIGHEMLISGAHRDDR